MLVRYKAGDRARPRNARNSRPSKRLAAARRRSQSRSWRPAGRSSRRARHLLSQRHATFGAAGGAAPAFPLARERKLLRLAGSSSRKCAAGSPTIQKHWPFPSTLLRAWSVRRRKVCTTWHPAAAGCSPERQGVSRAPPPMRLVQPAATDLGSWTRLLHRSTRPGPRETHQTVSAPASHRGAAAATRAAPATWAMVPSCGWMTTSGRSAISRLVQPWFS
jgi:hypothetical protein